MEIIQFLQTLLESKAEHTDFVDCRSVKDVISLKQKSQRELIDLSSGSNPSGTVRSATICVPSILCCATPNRVLHLKPLCDVELCISLWLCWC